MRPSGTYRLVVATSAHYFPERRKREPLTGRWFVMSRTVNNCLQLFVPLGSFSRFLTGPESEFFVRIHPQTFFPVRILLRTVGHGKMMKPPVKIVANKLYHTCTQPVFQNSCDGFLSHVFVPYLTCLFHKSRAVPYCSI